MTIKTRSQGFTIVELLIVIIVIAILAALVISAYTGIQNSAYNSAVHSDLSGAAKKIEIYKQQSQNGQYPASIAQLTSANIQVTKSAYLNTSNNLYYCASPTLDSYAIAARSKANKQYLIINGSVTTPSSFYAASQTCGEVGTTQLDAGYFSSGYSVTTGNWSTWVKD